MHHRLSSVAFPHSNCRAEVGVKTVKRLITGNIGKDGAINIDAFQAAILQYRNTPDPITKISPAMCLFGRPVKDLIPILPGKYSPHTTWKESLDLREEALRHRHIQQQEKWSEHTKPLPPLQVGDRVRIQNQTGLHPNKWDRTGTVIEVRQFHQYLIRVDGSGRQTLRNRKFLRKFVPMYQPPKRRSILEDITCLPPSRSPDRDDTTTLPSPPIQNPTPIPPEDQTSQATPTSSDIGAATPPYTPLPDTSNTQPAVETMPSLAPDLTVNLTPEPRPLRRSLKVRNPPDRLM